MCVCLIYVQVSVCLRGLILHSLYVCECLCASMCRFIRISIGVNVYACVYACVYVYTLLSVYCVHVTYTHYRPVYLYMTARLFKLTGV